MRSMSAGGIVAMSVRRSPLTMHRGRCAAAVMAASRAQESSKCLIFVFFIERGRAEDIVPSARMGPVSRPAGDQPSSSQRARFRSTRPSVRKGTPSASSSARCPGQPGAVRPEASTTRWQGESGGRRCHRASREAGVAGHSCEAGQPAVGDDAPRGHLRHDRADLRDEFAGRHRRGQSSLSFRRSAFSATIRWSMQS